MLLKGLASVLDAAQVQPINQSNIAATMIPPTNRQHIQETDAVAASSH